MKINIHLIDKGCLKTSKTVTDIYAGSINGKEFRVQVDSMLPPYFQAWERTPGGLNAAQLNEEEKDEILAAVELPLQDCPECDGWAENKNGNLCASCEGTGEVEGSMKKNRIQILTWRGYGDDEASTDHAVYGADEEDDLYVNTVKWYCEDNGLSFEEMMDGHRSTYEGEGYAVYTDADHLFQDGQVIEGQNGRKFRITIEEVL